MAELIDANDIMFTPFEPKTKNRYVMTIAGIPAYVIKTANRPQITFEEIELNHMNVKRFIKGFIKILLTRLKSFTPRA